MDKKKLWMWIGIAAAVVVVVLGIWFFAFRSNRSTVPDVIGDSVTDAVHKIEAEGYKLGTSTESTETSAPVGTVTAEDPPAGSTADKGTPINITVVPPPTTTLVAVPTVTSMEASAAANQITAAGLVPAPYRDYNAATPAGHIFGQVPPPGQQVPRGTTVALGVSLGVAPTNPKVPNVVGKSRDSATTALRTAGFGVKVYEAYSSSVAVGFVVSQFPGAGVQALAGAEVAIEVSKGKAPTTPTNVTVPNVVGKVEADATSALKNAGLGVETYSEYSDTVAKGNVVGQLPAAGEKVAPGTVVGIEISAGKAPSQGVSVPNVVGKTVDEATTALTDVGLKAVVVPDPQSTATPGTVFAQLPVAGSLVPPDSQVVIEVAGSTAKPTPY
ncbi:MAG: PASTA domain-containing protein [Coriobacteriia bacterium]|nr:PASTA domain-containing protein [Coriobacteriia bacterium]